MKNEKADIEKKGGFTRVTTAFGAGKSGATDGMEDETLFGHAEYDGPYDEEELYEPYDKEFEEDESLYDEMIVLPGEEREAPEEDDLDEFNEAAYFDEESNIEDFEEVKSSYLEIDEDMGAVADPETELSELVDLPGLTESSALADLPGTMVPSALADLPGTMVPSALADLPGSVESSGLADLQDLLAMEAAPEARKAEKDEIVWSMAEDLKKFDEFKWEPIFDNAVKPGETKNEDTPGGAKKKNSEFDWNIEIPREPKKPIAEAPREIDALFQSDALKGAVEIGETPAVADADPEEQGAGFFERMKSDAFLAALKEAEEESSAAAEKAVEGARIQAEEQAAAERMAEEAKAAEDLAAAAKAAEAERIEAEEKAAAERMATEASAAEENAAREAEVARKRAETEARAAEEKMTADAADMDVSVDMSVSTDTDGSFNMAQPTEKEEAITAVLAEILSTAAREEEEEIAKAENEKSEVEAAVDVSEHFSKFNIDDVKKHTAEMKSDENEPDENEAEFDKGEDQIEKGEVESDEVIRQDRKDASAPGDSERQFEKEGMATGGDEHEGRQDKIESVSYESQSEKEGMSTGGDEREGRQDEIEFVSFESEFGKEGMATGEGEREAGQDKIESVSLESQSGKDERVPGEGESKSGQGETEPIDNECQSEKEGMATGEGESKARQDGIESGDEEKQSGQDGIVSDDNEKKLGQDGMDSDEAAARSGEKESKSDPDDGKDESKSEESKIITDANAEASDHDAEKPELAAAGEDSDSVGAGPRVFNLADILAAEDENLELRKPIEMTRVMVAREISEISEIAEMAEQEKMLKKIKDTKASQKTKGRKQTTSGKTFAKFFLVTFLACVIVVGSGLGILDSILDLTPLKDTNASAGGDENRPVTDEKMDILFPGTGMYATDFKNSKRVNVLLLGTTKERLSDTIMLMSFDPESKRVDVISIPRDTYYSRDGYYSSYLKINAVNLEGPVAVADAVHNILLGVPINYYAVVNYEGVSKIVDAVGGVPMNVARNMYYVKKSENLIIDLKAGYQILDGAHALQFIRYRKGYREGDLGRVKAQQQFVKNAIEKVLTLQNMPTVARTALDNVNSDITLRAVLYVVSKVSGLSSENVNTFTLPGRSGTISKLSFWLMDEGGAIEEMMRGIYMNKPPVTSESAISGPAVAGVSTSGGAAGGTNP